MENEIKRCMNCGMVLKKESRCEYCRKGGRKEIATVRRGMGKSSGSNFKDIKEIQILSEKRAKNKNGWYTYWEEDVKKFIEDFIMLGCLTDLQVDNLKKLAGDDLIWH